MTTIDTKFQAAAVAMVKADHTSTTQVSTRRAPSRSAHQAAGTPKPA